MSLLQSNEKTLISDEPCGVLFHLEACQAPPHDYGAVSRWIILLALIVAAAYGVLR